MDLRSATPVAAPPVGDGLEVDVLVPGSRLAVRGRLDVRTVADARTALHEALEVGTGDLVLVLDAVAVGDATGLGLLVSVHRRALRSGRRLVLVGVPGPLDRLLRASRLSRVLAVEA